MAVQGKCSLCRHFAPLMEGHLAPKFAVTWLKRTSGTGKLRGGNDIRRRMQDANRLRILCPQCENLFSGCENYFAKHIFKPCWSGIVKEIDYDERLIRFMASLTWRQIIMHMQESNWPLMIHKAVIVKAEIIMRRYLLGLTKSLPIEHHLWKVPPAKHAPPIIQGRILDMNWYIFRSCDGTIAQNSADSFIYALIPGFVIAAPLTKNNLADMVGTRVGDSGRLTFALQRPDSSLLEFIVNRAYQTQSRLANLSPRQWEKIDRDNEANKQKLLDNAQYYFFIQYAEAEDTA